MNVIFMIGVRSLSSLSDTLNLARINTQFIDQVSGESCIGPMTIDLPACIVRRTGHNNSAFHVVGIRTLGLFTLDMMPYSVGNNVGFSSRVRYGLWISVGDIPSHDARQHVEFVFYGPHSDSDVFL